MAGMVLGIVAACLMIVGLIPCLGWIQWATIPISVVAAVLSIIAWVTKVSAHDTRGLGAPITGCILAAFAFFFGAIRLLWGGGCI